MWALLLCSLPIEAQPPLNSGPNARRPGLLLGGDGAPLESATDIDPFLPTGAQRRFAGRPTHLRASACSQLSPVCINYSISSTPGSVRTVLADFERSYDRLVHILQLPRPLPDLGLGPSAGLDLYWDESSSPRPQVQVFADIKRGSEDRASAFCRVTSNALHSQHFTTLCVAEALLLGVNAGATPHLRHSIALYLASLWGLTSRELSEIDDLQSNPQLSLIARDTDAHTSHLWPLIAFLDAHLGTSPGALPIALLQQSRNSSKPGAIEWQNEPDALEVLRQALLTEQRFGNFFLNFAVQRAFWGTSNAVAPQLGLLWTQRAGKVRFDWVISTESLPRKVAAVRPIEPLGSAYLWLQLGERKPHTHLAFRSEWEPPGNFRWTLVAVDRRGAELKRFDLPYVRGASSAERTLPDVPGVAAYLIVGFNLGGVDKKHPFDPDHEPWEPHGFTVYLAEVRDADADVAGLPANDEPRPD